MDKHLISIMLINHFNELLSKDLVTNEDGDTLSADSDEVKAFKDSEIYKFIVLNEETRMSFYN